MIKIGLTMILFLFSLVICAFAVPYNKDSDLDVYSDLPEEYFIEQLANRLQGSPKKNYLSAVESYPESLIDLDQDQDQDQDLAEPAFTYQFPPGVEDEDSEFAVRPPDPRFYHDTRERASDTKNEEPSKLILDDDTFELPKSVPVSSNTPLMTTSLNTPLKKDDQDSEEIADNSLYADTGMHAQIIQTPVHPIDDKQDVYFIAIVAGCSAAAVVLVMVISISWYKLQRNAKAAADIEYPAYGVTGPNKETTPTGDRKLAQSAQMYHYQHQKQQIIAMENRVASERNGSMSEAESDEENEEGDYTVYECPGLAPTGEMEVKNPLFHDDPTPATPAITNQNTGSTASPVTPSNKK